MSWAVLYERPASLSLSISLQTFHPFRSLLITSYHVFSGCSLWRLLLILKILHLLYQALTSIHSRAPNHCSLLSCKHSLMLFSFSLVLSSSIETLSSDLTLHPFNHPCIISLYFDLIFLFNWPSLIYM